MNATPRAIPNQLGQRPVLTYSDGENSSASVGVAVWRTALKSPLAAVLKVSREVCMLWSPEHELLGAKFQDIYENRGNGPSADPGHMARIISRKPVDPLHRQCGGSGVACLWIFLCQVWRRYCVLYLGNDSTPTHHSMI